mmetsp:Transcript_55255/g.152122  ORF Transcript_55255/g.152122 Transcript_55255/m.152122 type:complete len:304 (+) Transcript_55255:580-1491(+)
MRAAGNAKVVDGRRVVQRDDHISHFGANLGSHCESHHEDGARCTPLGRTAGPTAACVKPRDHKARAEAHAADEGKLGDRDEHDAVCPLEQVFCQGVVVDRRLKPVNEVLHGVRRLAYLTTQREASWRVKVTDHGVLFDIVRTMSVRVRLDEPCLERRQLVVALLAHPLRLFRAERGREHGDACRAVRTKDAATVPTVMATAKEVKLDATVDVHAKGRIVILDPPRRRLDLRVVRVDSVGRPCATTATRRNPRRPSTVASACNFEAVHGRPPEGRRGCRDGASGTALATRLALGSAQGVLKGAR